MNSLDDTQPIPRYQNLPNWPTDRLVKLREQAIRKRKEKLDLAAKHKPGTPWNTRAMREAVGYSQKIDAIEAVLSTRRK